MGTSACINTSTRRNSSGNTHVSQGRLGLRGARRKGDPDDEEILVRALPTRNKHDPSLALAPVENVTGKSGEHGIIR